MGYRSQVVLVVKNEVLPTALGEELNATADNSVYKDGWTLFEFESVKWYIDDPLVKQVKAWIKTIAEDYYTLTVLGEDPNDWESDGDAIIYDDCPFEIWNVHRLEYSTTPVKWDEKELKTALESAKKSPKLVQIVRDFIVEFDSQTIANSN